MLFDFHNNKNHAKLWRGFLNFVFPKTCLNCHKYGEYYCFDCYYKLEYLYKQNCPKCKKQKINGGSCFLCKKDYYLDGLLAAGSYGNDKLRKIIKTYKYQSVEALHSTLGKYLCDFLEKQFAEYKITIPNFKFFHNKSLLLIPIPISKQHLRYRGFNQSELIANHVSDKYKWQLLNDKLLKNKNTRAQTKVNEKKRLSNPLGSFSWHGDKITNNVILIDDVFTTGSTMNEAAKIIKENGAKKVWGLVLARGK